MDIVRAEQRVQWFNKSGVAAETTITARQTDTTTYCSVRTLRDAQRPGYVSRYCQLLLRC